MSEHFDQLVNYIRQHVQQGIAHDTIKQTLMQHNWDADSIDRAFAVVGGGQQPQQVEHYQQPTAQEPQKYTLAQSISDTVKAIQTNAGVFVVVTVIGYVFVILGIVLLGMLLNGMITAKVNILLALIVGSILYTAWVALASAFIVASSSLVISDGRQGRKSVLGATIAASIKQIGRLSLTNLLVSVISMLPFIFISYAPYILLILAFSGNEWAAVLWSPIIDVYWLWLCLAAAWMVFMVTLIGLAPYVALYESQVPLLKTLGRSVHLLANGGRWFLIKGMIFVFVLGIGIGMIASLAGGATTTTQSLNQPTNWLSLILMLVVSIVANGVLTMLYLNRRAVRG